MCLSSSFPIYIRTAQQWALAISWFSRMMPDWVTLDESRAHCNWPRHAWWREDRPRAQPSMALCLSLPLAVPGGAAKMSHRSTWLIRPRTCPSRMSDTNKRSTSSSGTFNCCWVVQLTLDTAVVGVRVHSI